MRTNVPKNMHEDRAVIIHIPHSSVVIPPGVYDQYVSPLSELNRELLRMTDHYTNELFAVPKNLAKGIIFPVSRLVVDPERFEDNSKEPMFKKGMGAIYTRTSDKRRLRRKISKNEQEDLLQGYYRPHHERLAAAAGVALVSYNRCLIIDAHSFPSSPLPYESDQRMSRPAICIGTDKHHTPKSLADDAMSIFRREFHTVKFNRPFRGTLVPSAYYKSDLRVQSIMIEVNRSLYMNEVTGEKLPGFKDVERKIRRAILQLVRVWNNPDLPGKPDYR